LFAQAGSTGGAAKSPSVLHPSLTQLLAQSYTLKVSAAWGMFFLSFIR
jgi:hypothetical protein